jgi:hypothetical protein
MKLREDTTMQQNYSKSIPRLDQTNTRKRTKMGIESQVYRIRHCFITKVLIENDNDLHLVIEGREETYAHCRDPRSEMPGRQELSIY